MDIKTIFPIPPLLSWGIDEKEKEEGSVIPIVVAAAPAAAKAVAASAAEDSKESIGFEKVFEYHIWVGGGSDDREDVSGNDVIVVRNGGNSNIKEATETGQAHDISPSIVPSCPHLPQDTPSSNQN